MYKAIFPYKYSTSEELQNGIRRALSQLKKHNFAIVSDPRVCRAISRTIPKHFRDDGTIIFSTNLNQIKVITIHPQFKLQEISPKKWKLIYNG